MLRTPAATLIAVVLVAACTNAPAAAPASAVESHPAIASAPLSTPRAAASSRIAAKPDWLLVAIGDSIPYGRLDCDGCKGYPALFGEEIERTTGKTVEVQNWSQHDGLTAARLAVELPASNRLKGVLAAADIIVISIGHNDTPWNALDDACDQDHGFFDGNTSASWDVLVGPCLDVEVDRFRSNLDAIVTEVVSLRAGKPTAIRLTTQYADIPSDPCCPPIATQVSTTVKNAFNKAACEVADRHGVVCVDVYHAFNGSDGSNDAGPLIAPDHTHPSAAGHRQIADLLMAAGLAPLE